MYVETQAMKHIWSSMNNLHESVLSLDHVGLRDWTQVPGLTTSTISLVRPSKILCNRRALYYRTWTHKLRSYWSHFYYTGITAFFCYTQKALFQTSVVMTYEKAHCPSQKSIQWQLGRFCWTKWAASPSPSILIPPSHSSGVTKVPCVAMVSHACSIYRRGGVEGNHYYMPSELEKSILFFLFYIIIIFTNLRLKSAWERGTHQLTFLAKNMTSQPKLKGPHYPCKSSVPFCTHEKNSS